VSNEDLRLCRLTAQNVLRLRCVDIEFDGAGALVLVERVGAGPEVQVVIEDGKVAEVRA
jgi:hypothetical protein